jgi:hypothetical protein
MPKTGFRITDIESGQALFFRGANGVSYYAYRDDRDNVSVHSCHATYPEPTWKIEAELPFAALSEALWSKVAS